MKVVLFEGVIIVCYTEHIRATDTLGIDIVAHPSTPSRTEKLQTLSCISQQFSCLFK